MRALAEGLAKKYEVRVTNMKAYRAKTIASKRVRGDYKQQYADLTNYVLELKRANPGTTIKLELDTEPNPETPTRQFKRICVYWCIEGWIQEMWKRFIGIRWLFHERTLSRPDFDCCKGLPKPRYLSLGICHCRSRNI